MLHVKLVPTVNNLSFPRIRNKLANTGRAANSGKRREPLRVRRTEEPAASLRPEEMLQKNVDRDNFRLINWDHFSSITMTLHSLSSSFSRCARAVNAAELTSPRPLSLVPPTIPPLHAEPFFPLPRLTASICIKTTQIIFSI